MNKKLITILSVILLILICIAVKLLVIGTKKYENIVINNISSSNKNYI